MNQFLSGLCQLELKLISNWLQAFFNWTVELVEKLESIEVVLTENREYAAIFAVQQLLLILYKDLLLENKQQFSVKVGPLKALVKTSLLSFEKKVCLL